jgi:hypothetical protein
MRPAGVQETSKCAGGYRVCVARRVHDPQSPICLHPALTCQVDILLAQHVNVFGNPSLEPAPDSINQEEILALESGIFLEKYGVVGAPVSYQEVL